MAASKLKDRWQAICQTQVFIISALFTSTITSMSTFAMFHPMLPFYLRRILSQNCSNSLPDKEEDIYNYNVTNVKHEALLMGYDSQCENETELETKVSEEIGVITGSGSAMMLFFCFLSGILIQKFSLCVNLMASWLLVFACPVIVYFADSVVPMCFANGVISAGQTYTFVAYAAVFTEFADNDKQLTRWHGCYRIFNGLGFVVGYAGISFIYQFIGHGRTMIILATVILIDAFIRLSIPARKKQVEVDSPNPVADPMLHQNGITVDKLEDKSRINYRQILLNPYILLTNIQLILLYTSTSMFWGTAPNFVATVLRAEQWQTGLMMGIGTFVNISLLFVASFVVNTHQRRQVALGMSHLLFAIGYAWYPFVRTVWGALPAETLVRTGKDHGALMLTTMYTFICDQNNIKKKNFIYGVATTCVSLGFTTGFYLSGILVVTMTFKWLYIAMSIMSCLLFVSSILYSGLKPSSPQKLNGQKPKLNVIELAGSALNFERKPQTPQKDKLQPRFPTASQPSTQQIEV